MWSWGTAEPCVMILIWYSEKEKNDHLSPNNFIPKKKTLLIFSFSVQLPPIFILTICQSCKQSQRAYCHYWHSIISKKKLVNLYHTSARWLWIKENDAKICFLHTSTHNNEFVDVLFPLVTSRCGESIKIQTPLHNKASESHHSTGQTWCIISGTDPNQNGFTWCEAAVHT